MENVKDEKNKTIEAKIAVAFSRSAIEDFARQNQSIDKQIDEIVNFANKNDFLLENFFDNIVIDSEQALGGLLSYCKACPDIHYVIVTEPTRISRNVNDYCYWKSELQRIGVTLITTAFDDTPTEQFIESLSQFNAFNLETKHKKLKELLG